MIMFLFVVLSALSEIIINCNLAYRKLSRRRSVLDFLSPAATSDPGTDLGSSLMCVESDNDRPDLELLLIPLYTTAPG